MSHQIAHAAKEQLDAGEGTAQRVVIISDTAENRKRFSESTNNGHH